jgi:hypothetical protein
MFTLPLLFGSVPFLQRMGEKNALKNQSMPLIKAFGPWGFYKNQTFQFFPNLFQWVFFCLKDKKKGAR